MRIINILIPTVRGILLKHTVCVAALRHAGLRDVTTTQWDIRNPGDVRKHAVFET